MNKALNVVDELLGNTVSCPLDHGDEATNGSLWDCDHPECVALQRAADADYDIPRWNTQPNA